MDELKAENIILLFKEQEDRLHRIIGNIPYNDVNKSIQLPILSSIIVECGSLLDTIMREEFDDSIKPKADCNIVDYAQFYEGEFSLSKVKNLFYITPHCYLTPFQGWIDDTGNYCRRVWWKSYNDLKHDRINNFDSSTLENAINTLCALHQAISQLPTFFSALLRHDMLSYGGMALQYVKEKLHDNPNFTVLVESRFFATPVGQYQFPDDISRIRDHIYGGSRRLAHFIGRN